MNTQSCQYCYQITTIARGSSTKPNAQMIGINGAIMYYKNGFKKYVKPCCLMAYYFGSEQLSNYLVNQNFNSIVKPKAPKYCITDNDAFPVYEISYKDQETIRNPESMNKNDKLEIVRYLKMIENPVYHKIVTKAAYDRKLKEWQNKTEDMDVDMECPINDADQLSNDKPQYVYLIQERTSVVAKQSIYKIGRTEQPNFERFKGYVKGYKILLHLACDDSKVAEKQIMDQFKSKYRHATEYGNEYFEGNYKKMITHITTIVFG